MAEVQHVDEVVVRDSAGAYYEVPWEVVTGHRVSEGRAQELAALFDEDTGGFLTTTPPLQQPWTRTIALPTRNIIAVLIG